MLRPSPRYAGDHRGASLVIAAFAAIHVPGLTPTLPLPRCDGGGNAPSPRRNGGTIGGPAPYRHSSIETLRS